MSDTTTTETMTTETPAEPTPEAPPADTNPLRRLTRDELAGEHPGHARARQILEHRARVIDAQHMARARGR